MCAKKNGDDSVILEQIESSNGCWSYVFTRFDTSETSPEELQAVLVPKCRKYIFSLERCPKTDRVHYQGAMWLHAKERATGVRKWFGDHYVASVRTAVGSYKYCKKKETHLEGPWSLGFAQEKGVLITVYYEWQQKVIDMISVPCVSGDRSIWWYWDGLGNKGKSWFARHLQRINDQVATATCTKSADIILLANENKSIYVIDIPRDASDMEPYVGLEQLKNGYVTEAKLKKSMRVVDMKCNTPHVIVFANVKPQEWRMSADRWRIFEIK